MFSNDKIKKSFDYNQKEMYVNFEKETEVWNRMIDEMEKFQNDCKDKNIIKR